MIKKFEKCCAICNGEFLTSYGQQVVCSKECKLAYRRKHHIPTTKQCSICNTDFVITINTLNARVCSIVCRDKKRHIDRKKFVKNKIKICIICSQEFLAIGNNKTCSDNCSSKTLIFRTRSQYNNNINFKLSDILRSRLRHAIKNNQKSGSAVKDLGCSIDDLKKYLESKFQPGMSWDNHGFRGWHIDHIRPLSNFDLSVREQFLIACHYTNLQPMWWRQNIVKGNKHVS